MRKKKEKRVLTKGQKIAKIIGISLASLFGLYFTICLIFTAVEYLPMIKQNEIAQAKWYGSARLSALREQGITTDYKPYSQAEIAANQVLDSVNLYYMPCDGAQKTEYVLICPGGGYTSCEKDGEGFPVAAKFNENGYTAFVLEYRVGKNCSYHAPLDDVAAALRFINANAEEFNVKRENYALCGFSAGGNLIGLFGSDELGYAKYALDKPAALIMGYPWCNLNVKSKGNLIDTIAHAALNGNGYRAFLGKRATKEQKAQMRVPTLVTANYPATYVMHGDSDAVVPYDTHTQVLCDTFDAYGVTYQVFKPSHVNHGIGIGVGTSAEGWLDDAIDFWQNRIV